MSHASGQPALPGAGGTPGRRVQYAALPFRVRRDGEVQIRLITSRETRRWVIPKGWPMKGISPPKAAARECYEEAGLLGEVAREPFGMYTYEKRLGARSVLCDVLVFPLKVKRHLQKWPERFQRYGFWFSIDSAAAAVQEEDLGLLIRAFGDVIARNQAAELEEKERGKPGKAKGKTARSGGDAAPPEIAEAHDGEPAAPEPGMTKKGKAAAPQSGVEKSKGARGKRGATRRLSPVEPGPSLPAPDAKAKRGKAPQEAAGAEVKTGKSPKSASRGTAEAAEMAGRATPAPDKPGAPKKKSAGKTAARDPQASASGEQDAALPGADAGKPTGGKLAGKSSRRAADKPERRK